MGGCGSSTSGDRLTGEAADSHLACESVRASVIENIIGPSSSQAFEEPPMSECTWRSEGGSITVRIEIVPDPRLFIEHAIESTDPTRVAGIDAVSPGAVEFAGEALLGAHGDRIVLVEGSAPTSQLRPVLSAAVASLVAAP